MSQEKNPERTFDIRTLDFQLQRGIITQKEYDQYLKTLPNDEGNLEEVVMEEDPADSYEDEDEDEEPLE
jgi:hypothetical protein